MTQPVVTPFVPAMTWRGRTAGWIARTPTGVTLLSFDQRLVELTEGGSQLPDKRRHVRTLGSGARVDLTGLGDSVVAVAHLPIDVRAAGAIGAGAVHAFVGDGVHRQWGRRRTVLDLLAGPQNPNYEGPVIEGSSSQVLTAGQCATRTGACDDRSWLRVAAGWRRPRPRHRPRPASRRDPRGVMAAGAGDHAMPAMAGARSAVVPRAAAGRRREEVGSIR